LSGDLLIDNLVMILDEYFIFFIFKSFD